MNINNLNTEAQSSVEKIPVKMTMPSSEANTSEASGINAPEKAGPRTGEAGRRRSPEKTEEEQGKRFSAEEAEQLAEEMNGIMDDLQTSLGFSIREELNHQVIVEITDRDTKELIKQIPSEELLAIKGKMEELSGLLFDQTV